MESVNLDFWKQEELKNLWGGRKDNYKICCNEGAIGNNCIIFFSSNGLYFPNEISIAYETICVHDKYDWENISKHKVILHRFKKVIFVRDIYKQWYITGINEDIDSVDKMVVFFQKETRGYDVYTAGSSAGGYAAALFGCLLNAKAAYCFSAQFSIYDQIEKAPFVKRFKGDERSKYFDIRPFIDVNKDTFFFYFFPAYCEWDIVQNQLIKNLNNIKSFAFDQHVHGATMLNGNIPYIITKDLNQLADIAKDTKGMILSQKKFLFMTMGLIGGCKVLIYRVIRKIKNFSKDITAKPIKPRKPAH